MLSNVLFKFLHLLFPLLQLHLLPLHLRLFLMFGLLQHLQFLLQSQKLRRLFEMLNDLWDFGVDLAIKYFHYLFCFFVEPEIELGDILELSKGKVVLRCDAFLLKSLLQILRIFDG